MKRKYDCIPSHSLVAIDKQRLGVFFPMEINMLTYSANHQLDTKKIRGEAHPINVSFPHDCTPKVSFKVSLNYFLRRDNFHYQEMYKKVKGYSAYIIRLTKSVTLQMG